MVPAEISHTPPAGSAGRLWGLSLGRSVAGYPAMERTASSSTTPRTPLPTQDSDGSAELTCARLGGRREPTSEGETSDEWIAAAGHGYRTR
jgi:hypothetical protein